MKPIKKLNCYLCPRCRIVLDNLYICQRCGYDFNKTLEDRIDILEKEMKKLWKK